MKKSKLFSFLSVSLWGFLAMNCISCAHQAKEVALVIDTAAPVEEQVLDDKKDSSDVVASNEETAKSEVQSEESQLQAVENELKSELENQGNLNVASNDEAPAAETATTEEKEVVSPQVAKLDANTVLSTEPKSQTTPPSEEVASPSREVASEPKNDDVGPSSQTEPTVGVPAKLKYNEKLPSRKKQNTSQASPVHAEKEIASNSEASVPESQEVASVSKAEPKTNELGEEEDSSPQLASVEIATFVQRHWLVVMLGALVTTVGLFFMVRRKQNDDSQPI